MKILTAFPTSKELLFQLVLHCVVFSLYVYEDDAEVRIEEYRIIYFFHYALMTAIVSYVLLPRFFYRKKYILFLTFLLLIVAGVIAIEELVLEQIFFPSSRANSFPGVFFSLWEVLPVIVILAGCKFAWDALLKQREVDDLKAAMKESELQFLKSQINPHFLFNNLNNLYAYAIEGSPKTPAIILELSSVLRYMLYECQAKVVPLRQEIEQLKNFTQLSQLQIEERGVVNFHASPVGDDYQIAPLILIVFIENAFKHSQAGQSENILIDIYISLSGEGQLQFTCKNNFLATTKSLTRGIGLENVSKRLQLLYPGAHQLAIQQVEEFYTVCLSMQVEKTTTYALHHH